MPTIADVMKGQGYATGQFGKNHLGDHDQHLPTNHGFDEFLGNLYHLNAEEEPEGYFYPKDPEFRKKFGPRGVIHSTAGISAKIEDTGPLNTKRMPTIDEEFLEATQKFIKNAVKNDTPFFVWFNTTRMHVFTHLKKESVGKTGKVCTRTAWWSMTEWSASFWISLTNSASPTTPSFCTQPTTERNSRCGPTVR